MTHKYSRNTAKARRHWMMLVMVCLAYSWIPQSGYAQSASNDHIFPASANAKPFIDFDSKGFLIHGKREFLVSAGIEYARVPHELWKDRLLRLKRGGFNCVEIYTFWNFHEPQEGRFNFSGDHDLDAFLKLAGKLGLYAIVRVGPYYCAEWADGGYPLWLRFKPGVRVREHNPAFEKYTDRFWDTLMPIVCRNQINHGGSVILVQLENEHPDGWGTYMPNEYFRHLRSKALSLGLEVPYFFSGLHHSGNPAANGKLDDPSRPNPWMSTEFWSVGFTVYSSTLREARIYERRTWRIVANGGNGYNYYMAHGGSNFGYTNNDEDAASYDYGAAVGQTGDLRPIYYRYKRVAFFARSFQNVLENSSNGISSYRKIGTDSAVRITARKSAAGDIVFLDNPANKSVTTKIDLNNGSGGPDYYPVELDPKEILPLVHDFKINNAVTLNWGLTRVLGISREGNTTSFVIYGKPGTSADMRFTTSAQAVTDGDQEVLSVGPREVTLHAAFSTADQPALYSFRVNDQKICLIAVNENLCDRTWFIPENGKNYIVCGPYYVGELQQHRKGISITTEHPWHESEVHASWIFGSSGLIPLHPEAETNAERKTSLALSAWEMKNEAEAAGPAFNDRNWKQSTDPLQMGADGDLSPDAWYRTRFRVGSAGTYTLQVKGGDRATVFVDGRRAATADMKDGEIVLELTKGKHLLAVFTAHNGRDKLAAFLGSMEFVAAKGLYGKVSLVKGRNSMQNLTEWKFLKASSIKDTAQGPPAADVSGWKKYIIGEDVFDHKTGFGWFSTTLQSPPPGVQQIRLDFKSVDENATVFVNGIRIGKHDGWNIPFSFTINRADTLEKPIRLDVFIENYSNEGGINEAVHATDLLPSAQSLTGWRMHGGIPDPEKISGWKPAGQESGSSGPCFFRSSFMLPAVTNSRAIYRVTTRGLGHGSVWVNGHNLGRYPETIPVNGIYIPACWMKTGSNRLYIYDEDGKYPGDVSIEAEMAASRDLQLLSDF